MPAPLEAPPINLYDYWETTWLTGPRDGPQEYFDKWYETSSDPEFDTIPFDNSTVSVRRRKEFTGLHEYRFLDNSAMSSGAHLRYMVAIEDDGRESMWGILEGLTDLQVAWRFDLIETFRGEPEYAQLKEIVLAYWRNERAPRLLMQVDAKSLEFFFVPRDEGSPG